MSAPEVAASNHEMAKAWDGDSGATWARNAEAFDRTARFYQPLLVSAVGAHPDDRVLDIGCGAGRLSLDCARTAGSVLGVDLSGEMLSVARARAASAGLTNVEFSHGDAQVHPFEASAYDVATSRWGTMFFGDPEAAFSNIARALRPSGRLVIGVWQGLERSEWIRVIFGSLAAGRELPPPSTSGPGPLGLSDPARVRSILGASGFVDISLDDVAQPVDFGPTTDDALAFVLDSQAWLLKDLDEPTRTSAVATLRSALDAHLTPDGVHLASAAWFITATRA